MTALDADPPTQVHGAPGERCATCAVPLAPDQRYCLECGTRRAAPRVPVAAALPAGAPALVQRETVLPPTPMAPVQRLGGIWGVAALLLVALGVGVVIGRSGEDAPVAAAPAPVIVGASPTGTTAVAAVAGGAAADEWPDQDGFTVQLGELPKDGTDQAAADAAKAAATAKGAADVGVLDAGAHGLTAGNLVLYSGVFTTRKQATAALADVRDAYPDARVIAVKATGSASKGDAAADDDAKAGDAAGGGDGSTPPTVSKDALKAKESLSPEEFQKQTKKPRTTALPGKPPPKDDKAPGGGSDAETIG